MKNPQEPKNEVDNIPAKNINVWLLNTVLSNLPGLLTIENPSKTNTIDASNAKISFPLLNGILILSSIIHYEFTLVSGVNILLKP
jgi:hypothetical protein